jgi:hypothetical protein
VSPLLPVEDGCGRASSTSPDACCSCAEQGKVSTDRRGVTRQTRARCYRRDVLGPRFRPCDANSAPVTQTESLLCAVPPEDEVVVHLVPVALQEHVEALVAPARPLRRTLGARSAPDHARGASRSPARVRRRQARRFFIAYFARNSSAARRGAAGPTIFFRGGAAARLLVERERRRRASSVCGSRPRARGAASHR